ncbi:MAG: hypothetical protein AAGD96_28410, partial [Chloroflexota bacterium]
SSEVASSLKWTVVIKFIARQTLVKNYRLPAISITTANSFSKKTFAGLIQMHKNLRFQVR